jgi:hypothetical protein
MLLTGLALLAAALGLLTRLPVTGGYAVYLLPTMLLVGGGGLVLPAMTGLGMSAASPSDAGVVSGLFNTTQQVGGALGVAVLSTLAAARTKGLVADGRSAASALTGGYHLAFGIGASLVIAAFVIAFSVLRQPRTKLQTSLVGERVGGDRSHDDNSAAPDLGDRSHLQQVRPAAPDAGRADQAAFTGGRIRSDRGR